MWWYKIFAFMMPCNRTQRFSWLPSHFSASSSQIPQHYCPRLISNQQLIVFIILVKEARKKNTKKISLAIGLSFYLMQCSYYCSMKLEKKNWKLDLQCHAMQCCLLTLFVSVGLSAKVTTAPGRSFRKLVLFVVNAKRCKEKNKKTN